MGEALTSTDAMAEPGQSRREKLVPPLLSRRVGATAEAAKRAAGDPSPGWRSIRISFGTNAAERGRL